MGQAQNVDRHEDEGVAQDDGSKKGLGATAVLQPCRDGNRRDQRVEAQKGELEQPRHVTPAMPAAALIPSREDLNFADGNVTVSRNSQPNVACSSAMWLCNPRRGLRLRR